MSLARQTSRLWRLYFHALWMLIGIVSLFVGLNLRDWTWKETAPIRFRGDISNALNIGRETVLSATTFKPGSPLAFPDWASVWRAYLNRYDVELQRVETRQSAGQFFARYRIDYPPGRLLIATAWANSVVSGPSPGSDRPRGMGTGYSDEYATPLLWTNTGHEIAAAIGMFFLVRRILLNANRRYFVSELLAMLSALLLWFNPALIIDAHGWPQWEAWVLPYTIWAAYAALIDGWLVAGALIAVGAMLKGQVLMFAPIFPLWAIFSLRVGALLRFANGFFAMVALLMWPWLVRDTLPAVWVVAGTIAFVGLILSMKSRRSRLAAVAAAVLVGTICSPWLAVPRIGTWFIVAGVMLFVCVVIYVIWRKRASWTLAMLAAIAGVSAALLPTAISAAINREPPAWLAMSMPMWSFANAAPAASVVPKLALGSACLIAAIALLARGRSVIPATLAFFAVLTFLAAVSFDGSFAWLKVGFQTVRYDELSMGRVCNLPAILGRTYGLGVDSPTFTFGVFAEPLTLSHLLKGLAAIGLVLCALALAIQVRRKDANALIPLVAAWTLLYALLPQMHERYLVWGAAVSALLVTRGIGGLLLHLALTVMQTSMLVFAMSTSHGRGESIEALRPWLRVFEGMHPESGYIVVTLAFVLLCWSFRSSRRELPPKRPHATPQVLLKESIRVADVKRLQPATAQ